jgi:exopolysaccharide production protein ExoQ
MTTTIQGGELEATSVEVQAQPRGSALLGWLLMLPFVFFAVHGVFSFEVGYAGDQVSSRAYVYVAAARNMGIIGYVILPGIAYSVVMAVLFFNIRGVIDMAIRRKALTFLALLTVFSAAWSQDPMRSLLNGGFYLVGTLFAYYLVLRFSPEEIMDLVIRAGVLVCLLSAVMVFVFPSHGINYEEARTMGAWHGIFEDRVSGAKCCVYLLSPALIFGAGRKRLRNVLYIAFVLLFIVMAQAVSALAVTFTFAVIMVALQISRRLERNLALLLGAGVGIFCIAFALFGVPLLTAIFSMLGRDMTLTGRTEIWAILMTSIAKHPLLGYGFYAFWQGLNGESANVILAAHWMFGYAHNGLLEIVLQLGLVGAAVFLFTFVNGCKDAWYCIKYGRTPGVEWYCGVLVLAVLYNIDEETILWPNDLLSMLYVVACCGLAVQTQRIRKERAAGTYALDEPAAASWAGAAAES